MSITADRKQELIKEYAVQKDDTGSPEVQVHFIPLRVGPSLALLKIFHVLNIKLKQKPLYIQVGTNIIFIKII